MDTASVSTIACRRDGSVVICDDVEYTLQESVLTPKDPLFWVFLGSSAVLVTLSGIFSGLIIGVLSLDVLSLRVLMEAGETENERWAAKKILPLARRHHYVLVSLVMSNAACNEALPICMDKVFTEAVAIALSITIIMVFGELIPQAVCARYGLTIAANAFPLIVFLMVLTFPIAAPLSVILDFILGQEQNTFYGRRMLKRNDREHFQALIALHGPRKNKASKAASTAIKGQRKNDGSFLAIFTGNSGYPTVPIFTTPLLAEGEVMMIQGALSLREKTVGDATIPLDSVFMLELDDKLDRFLLDLITSKKFSRIPIYEKTRTNIKKVLLVKTLLPINPEEKLTIKGLPKRSLINADLISADASQYDALNHFQQGICHLLIVVESTSRMTSWSSNDASEDSPALRVHGIVTMEDILEEILQKEIYDEMDTLRTRAKLLTLGREHDSRSKGAIAVSSGKLN
ncbi:unnamed protein product [Notodromas monacha]|uniref:CNNM transmembrane domain-containing protein n=1 Tax=Notodromas monacha TaxID=399045 RepID=A0A7R9BIJ2_9CRUS|nr:unnamed protein product [Notodromas monacha]CAG0914763.1 unnamed protein product [Notodromas monacha]